MLGESLNESWQQARRRMLEETSRYIEWGLAHPEEVIEIPCKLASTEGFPAEVARWFWGVVLSDSQDSRFQRWRGRLMGRQRQFLRRGRHRLWR